MSISRRRATSTAAPPRNGLTLSNGSTPTRLGYSCCKSTNRNWQYVSVADTERLAEIGARPSIGSIGDSYDNALAETVNGLYKTELIRRQGPWRNVEHVELATLAWVEWFNNRRLHGELDDIPPAEFEALHYAQSRTQKQIPTPTRT